MGIRRHEERDHVDHAQRGPGGNQALERMPPAAARLLAGILARLDVPRMDPRLRLRLHRAPSPCGRGTAFHRPGRPHSTHAAPSSNPAPPAPSDEALTRPLPAPPVTLPTPTLPHPGHPPWAPS